MKRFISLLLVLLMIVSLAACGSKDDDVIVLDGPAGSSDNDSSKKYPPAPAPGSDANKDPEPLPEDVPPAENDPVPDDGSDEEPTEEDEPVLSEDVVVYFSDDSGVNFISFPASLASADVTGVIGALKDYGVLDSGVKANSFTTVKNDGKTYIKLELNSAFTDQVTAAGDSYGYMLLGSVVNTLLDAYDAVGVQVTVGGRALELGGTTYSGYLTKFGANPIPPAPQEEEPGKEGENAPTDDNPVVATALSLQGAPYKYGGEGPDAFDNSGFVYYCFKANGITIPRRTSSMFLEGIAVNKNDLRKGDVVFFSFDESSTSPTYVAIYLGDGKAIAESNESKPVSIFSINTSYYTKNYVGAKRYV